MVSITASLAVAAQRLVAVQLLDPLEVDDRHHADQQVDVARDVDLGPDVAAVQAFVEQQVAVPSAIGCHGGEGARLAAEFAPLAGVVQVARARGRCPLSAYSANACSSSVEQVALGAEVADRRALAVVGTAHALAHLVAVEAMERVAFDDLRLEPSRRKMCAKLFITVVVPAPDEPVTAMMGWRVDMPRLRPALALGTASAR